MMHIKVTWKDSNARGFKPVKYRNHYLTGYKGGWIVDIEGDDNIYKNHYCAQNAIDKHLGSKSQKGGSKKRTENGIQIIGKKSDYERTGEPA